MDTARTICVMVAALAITSAVHKYLTGGEAGACRLTAPAGYVVTRAIDITGAKGTHFILRNDPVN